MKIMKINGYENLNFVKWAGGKGHLINQIEQYLPKKIDRYFEPFIGGGALFFYIMQKYKPQFAFISDINQNLITTYEVIRDDVEVLIQQLYIHKENHRKDFEKFGNKKTIKIHELNKKAKKIKLYLEKCGEKRQKAASDLKAEPPQSSADTHKAQIELELIQILNELKDIKNKKRDEDKQRYYYIQREIYNKNKTLSKVEIASYFIYLNKAGFNGMYRENLQGHLNIPKGDLKEINIDEKKLRKASKILNQNVQIRCAPYNEIDALAKENDFIYFDPPYAPLKKKSFTTYTKNPFLEEEQKQLAFFCKKLNIRNVKFMLSNHNTDLIRQLFSSFHIKVVSAKRTINSDATGRGNVDEVLVINY